MRTTLLAVVVALGAVSLSADPTAGEAQSALEGRTYMRIQDGGTTLSITFSPDGTLLQKRLLIVPEDGGLATVVEGTKEKRYVMANTLRLDAVMLFVFGTLEGETGEETFFEHYRLSVGNDGWETIFLQDLREGAGAPGPPVPYRRFE